MLGFLSLSYWFSLYPPALLPVAQTVFSVIFGASVIGGLSILYILRRRNQSKARRHALGSLGHVLLWAGICGFIWLFMTLSGVPLLGMRLMLLLGAVLFGYLSLRPIRMLRIEIPQAELGAQSRANYEKWLPKPRK